MCLFYTFFFFSLISIASSRNFLKYSSLWYLRNCLLRLLSVYLNLKHLYFPLQISAVFLQPLNLEFSYPRLLLHEFLRVPLPLQVRSHFIEWIRKVFQLIAGLYFDPMVKVPTANGFGTPFECHDGLVISFESERVSLKTTRSIAMKMPMNLFSILLWWIFACWYVRQYPVWQWLFCSSWLMLVLLSWGAPLKVDSKLRNKKKWKRGARWKEGGNIHEISKLV